MDSAKRKEDLPAHTGVHDNCEPCDAILAERAASGDFVEVRTVTVNILWTDDVEAAYQKFKAQNTSGVFPATEENFVQAVFANAVATQ